VTLKADLKLFQVAAKKPNPYEAHGLLENPFPGFGETSRDVCTNQDTIKGEFVKLLHAFPSGAKRLRIDGGSGAGKTNILRYLERLADEARVRRLIGPILPVYVNAPGDSYFSIHEQLVDKISEMFWGDLLGALQAKPDLLETLPAEIKASKDVLSSLSVVVKQKAGSLFDVDDERHRYSFTRWLKGQKLPAREKKLLGPVSTEVDSAAVAIRYLDGILQVLHKLNLCQGLVLFFDEFEEIFESLSRAQQSRYAQDLRHLFDTLEASVLFVVATIPQPRDLAQYPAIVRRLGDPHVLEPIGSADVAKSYVADYLAFGRQRFWEAQDNQTQKPTQAQLSSFEPLKVTEIEQEFESVKTHFQQTGQAVLPGFFLPRMRDRMRSVVEGSQ
jgi:hypothetical protein